MQIVATPGRIDYSIRVQNRIRALQQLAAVT